MLLLMGLMLDANGTPMGVAAQRRRVFTPSEHPNPRRGWRYKATGE